MAGFLERLGQIFLDAAEERISEELQKVISGKASKAKRRRSRPRRIQQAGTRQDEIAVTPDITYLPPKRIKNE